MQSCLITVISHNRIIVINYYVLILNYILDLIIDNQQYKQLWCSYTNHTTEKNS